MNVNNVNAAGIQPGSAGTGVGGGQMDAESKNLQQQIERLQQQLKEVSANQDMPADTKMKKRQEIQKQISQLEIQLRQHQIEARKEEREKKREESSFDDLMGTKPQEKQNASQKAGMSAGSMEAMISADVSVKQANANGSTAKKMKGRAGVLEAEIKLDSGRSGSSNMELKEAELAKTKEAADQATASQMEALNQAGKTLENAAKNEKTTEKKADNKEEESKTTSELDKTTTQTNVASDAPVEEVTGEENGFVYHSVDVRL